MSASRPVRGRLAPSPTGFLHLGNAWAFLLAWLACRSKGGSLVLRMEDIDPDRSRAEYADAIIRDLRWLGLDWDEGPDAGGPAGPYVQSARMELYADALNRLGRAGHIYPCYCTRKELRTLAGAPHVGDAGAAYPGTCRNLPPERRAELEAAGKLTAVITQNIDGLHQAAGSKNVLELHGSIHRNYCMRCKKQYSARFVKESKGIPTCDCGGTIRPDVVLYEEGLDNQIIQKSIRAISEADMLIIGGTSLVVYPAAGFIDYFHGKYLVLINKDATARDAGATLTIHEPIGEVLDRIHV